MHAKTVGRYSFFHYSNQINQKIMNKRYFEQRMNQNLNTERTSSTVGVDSKYIRAGLAATNHDRDG